MIEIKKYFGELLERLHATLHNKKTHAIFPIKYVSPKDDTEVEIWGQRRVGLRHMDSWLFRRNKKEE